MKYLLLILVLVFISCKKSDDSFEKKYTWEKLKVTATAYNSLAYQTNSNPHITAFGDSLKPGLKYIAVSRDLFRKGLKHNTPVKIEGFDGIYFVKDRMHNRWKNKIDIYMGVDVKAAKKWGRKKVTIFYGVLKDTIKPTN
jgi:3D (Asp-Asp-Asp) domain-containing protein